MIFLGGEVAEGMVGFPIVPLLFTVLLCLPTAQALYITAGSLVALYNGQCMMTCITKMISDRR